MGFFTQAITQGPGGQMYTNGSMQTPYNPSAQPQPAQMRRGGGGISYGGPAQPPQGGLGSFGPPRQNPFGNRGGFGNQFGGNFGGNMGGGFGGGNYRRMPPMFGGGSPFGPQFGGGIGGMFPGMGGRQSGGYNQRPPSYGGIGGGFNTRPVPVRPQPQPIDRIGNYGLEKQPIQQIRPTPEMINDFNSKQGNMSLTRMGPDGQIAY